MPLVTSDSVLRIDVNMTLTDDSTVFHNREAITGRIARNFLISPLLNDRLARSASCSAMFFSASVTMAFSASHSLVTESNALTFSSISLRVRMTVPLAASWANTASSFALAISRN